MRVIEAMRQGEDILRKGNIEDPKVCSKIFMTYVLNIDSAGLILALNKELLPKDYKTFLKCVKRRLKHEPVNYITGTKNFMDMTFKCKKGVLIPRGDTEVLVIESLRELLNDKNNENNAKVIKNNDEEKIVMDMCTGTGCVALSLAKALPNSKVIGVDISNKALRLSKENKELNKIENCVFIKSNLFSSFKGLEYEDRFDMIVSNPPYIKTEICKTLEKDVKSYEPMLALDGGRDGLVFYKRIMHDAKRLLKDNGILAFEIDYTYKDVMTDLLKEENYDEIKCFKDVEERDRVIIARLHKY